MMIPESSKKILIDDITSIKMILLQLMTRIEGDDFEYGAVRKIQPILKKILENPARDEIDPRHFQIMLSNLKKVVANIQSCSELMSNVSIRYGSDKCNKNLLDRMIENFSLKYEKEDYNIAQLTKKGANDDTRPCSKSTTDN